MKALRLAILALFRDGKSGELRVLLLALLVAVPLVWRMHPMSRTADAQEADVPISVGQRVQVISGAGPTRVTPM